MKKRFIHEKKGLSMKKKDPSAGIGRPCLTNCFSV